MPLKSWHIFLGHPSVTTMKHLKFITDANENEAFEVIKNCEVCLKAKQTRDPFPQLNERSEILFELIHGDIWGPYGDENVNNTKFVLTLVEDHSRVIWTYLLQSKDQVPTVLYTFIKIVENQFDAHIKYFRSDNGKEFVNKRVAQLLWLWHTTSKVMSLHTTTKWGGGKEKT